MINRLDACNYILKSHGDIDDIESIILTREDYAKLYQDTSNIAQTLKTLFLTRTVIFVGFGLNDPDFDYIRDHITNTYGCKQIVHYAIMPDMEEGQKDTDPAVASLILSMESVVSMLAGWVILGQELTVKELFGCMLVFFAVILVQLPDRNKSIKS